ncbi:MAG: 5-dehydro-2-deoxygluconokinase [Firmicutes bacterium]|nr:5-dehydro-2-deoxygluconokinase [Bacillota bacterium]
MKTIRFDSTKIFDIILVGRIAIDFNPVDLNKPLEESTTFKKYLGGSPANIAVGMSRLGKKVGFIGKVSDDQFGRFVTNYFNKEGIDTSGISVAKSGESLGLTFTEILSPSESSILMYRNGVADLALSVEDVSEDYIKSAKAIVISGTALAASPSREAALLALEYAKRHGAVVIFDIDYRSYTWKNKEELMIYYSTVARSSDIILGSKEEFDFMESHTGNSDKKIADRWISFGNKIVVIKHGKEGSTAYTDDNGIYKIKPFPVQTVKSFGGGDAYASAFLYGLMEGWPVIDCLEFGSGAASMLVSSHSCSDAMPRVGDIVDFIRREKAEYGEMVARA